MTAPRVGNPIPDGGPITECKHVPTEYAPECGRPVDYHVIVEDGQQYGYGVVAMRTCGEHLLYAIAAGVLVSAHLAGPQCITDVTLIEAAAAGCIPPHVFGATVKLRIVNPKDRP